VYRTMVYDAYHAVRAASNRHQWGPYAARRYVEKRGVPVRLYWLAGLLQLRGNPQSLEGVEINDR
jgi:hypothetical protein